MYSYFNFYLIELKNLKTGLLTSFLKFFLKICFSFLAKSKESRGLSSLSSIKAFLKICIFYNRIKNNRIKNINQDYCFLK